MQFNASLCDGLRSLRAWFSHKSLKMTECFLGPFRAELSGTTVAHFDAWHPAADVAPQAVPRQCCWLGLPDARSLPRRNSRQQSGMAGRGSGRPCLINRRAAMSVVQIEGGRERPMDLGPGGGLMVQGRSSACARAASAERDPCSVSQCSTQARPATMKHGLRPPCAASCGGRSQVTAA